jgi:hypothetical protein
MATEILELNAVAKRDDVIRHDDYFDMLQKYHAEFIRYKLKTDKMKAELEIQKAQMLYEYSKVYD